MNLLNFLKLSENLIPFPATIIGLFDFFIRLSKSFIFSNSFFGAENESFFNFSIHFFEIVSISDSFTLN